jgi:hypothetical protein
LENEFTNETGEIAPGHGNLLFRPCILCGDRGPEQLILCLRDWCCAIGFCSVEHLREVHNATGGLLGQLPEFQEQYQKWLKENPDIEQSIPTREPDEGSRATLRGNGNGYL